MGPLSSNGDGDVRVAGDEEGEGTMAMAMATRMVGEWSAMAMKRAMAMGTRVVGKQRLRRQRGR
jgi:hypothetical protein